MAPPGRTEADDLPPEVRRKALLRVLENLKRAIYCHRASNGIVRGNPVYSGPQIFPLAREALYMQAILRTAKAFDHHPKATSWFMFQALRPDVVQKIAEEREFQMDRLETFATKLRKIRNRALAHEDIDDIRRDRDVWEEQEISGGELTACIEFAFAALDEILNREFGERVELLNYDGADAEELARIANAQDLNRKWMTRLF
jgi:hypothetical protein